MNRREMRSWIGVFVIVVLGICVFVGCPLVEIF
jgi:hypothetical protein